MNPDRWTDDDLHLARIAYEAATEGVHCLPWGRLQDASRWRWVRVGRAVAAADQTPRHARVVRLNTDRRTA